MHTITTDTGTNTRAYAGTYTGRAYARTDAGTTHTRAYASTHARADTSAYARTDRLGRLDCVLGHDILWSVRRRS
jgi:hypothetical protein